MIKITKHPYLCCFTKNSIEFEVTSDLQFDTATVYPKLVLLFTAKPVLGTTFAISFTNPESERTETVDLVAVDGSIASNYSEKWQIPDTSFSGSLAELRTIVFRKLNEFQIFNAFYSIDLPIIEFPGSTPRITITAKNAIAELVMNWASNQPTATIDKYIREDNSVAYHQPGVRDGYALNASLFLESNYNSGKFNFVTTIDLVLDENSISHVDVSKYIDAEIEASWREYPVPFEQTLGYIAPNLRRYYVQFSETFTNQTQEIETTSETLFAHWGGASSDDSYTSDLIAAQNTIGNWLTWWPSGKRILKEQSDWLAWMNGAEKVTFNVVCTITTNLGTIEKIVHAEIALEPFETFVFNSGFDANELYLELGSDEIANNWGFSLVPIIQGCDVILINYTLLGQEQQSVIVQFIDGQYLINNFIGANDLLITTSETGWNLFYNVDFFQGSLTNNGCPFGTFTLEHESIFQKFEVLPRINFSVPQFFKYFFEKACLTKQIVYFNSFGIPESFILSANWQQNITTSQELATRTESYALDTLYPQNYIFDSKALISYQAETMMLKNLEAERLMPLINSTITFLLENGNFIPLIVNAGTTAVYQVNTFLQKIKLDLVRANESDRVSYYETLPDFEVFTTNSIGFSIIYLKRNLLNITNFGSIKIYHEGVELQEFTYVPTQKWYTGTAITTEGILTLELTCEVNGVEKVVRKQFNYKWDELRYEVFAMANDALVRFSSLYSSGTPMRIDWSDGTVDDVTVTTATVFTKNYYTNGKKIIRISKPSFFDITQFTIQNASNNFDFSKFDRLSDLIITNCAAGNYYLTALNNLQEITFIDTTIYQLNLGYQKYLLFLILNNSNISADNFELLIREIWNFRKSYDNAFEIRITSEVVVNSVAQAIIDGTGAYAGDGLADYGITLINI